MNSECLKGRTAVITGAAKRIGKSLALFLSRHGVNIIVHHYSSSQEDVDSLLKAIKANKVSAKKIKADLSNPKEAEGFFKKLNKRAGPVDILINNAAVYPEDRLCDLSWPKIQKTLLANAYGPLTLCQHFAKQAPRGNIINFLDASIHDYDRDHASYQMSKILLAHITKCLALELAPNIRVNAVAPGAILPPPGKTEQHLRKIEKNIPLETHPTCRHINDAALFLLANPSLTGQTIYVDGGQHLRRVCRAG